MPSAGRDVRVIDGLEVRFTSGDREVLPGISKAALLDYHLAVAPSLLARIGGRPTALERWPAGVHVGAEHFFAKHLPKSVPDYVHGCRVRFPSGRAGTLLCPDTAASIAWAVQMGTITFHAWPVTAPDTEHPDELRIDLDPAPGMGLADARRATALACEVLDDRGWPARIKTSGSRGFHVFVPIRPIHSFIDVRHAAIVVGREMERRAPDLITTAWWKEERGTRVFVDFNQNAQDRLMASAYSVRTRPDARVSMPIDRAELAGVDPAAFTVRTVPTIVAGRQDPWADGAAPVDLSPALAEWDEQVAAGLPELPYPPEFPKMPGEPPRVQPSRARRSTD